MKIILAADYCCQKLLIFAGFLLKKIWLAWVNVGYWYRLVSAQKICKSHLERVVLKHWIKWLWLERAIF